MNHNRSTTLVQLDRLTDDIEQFDQRHDQRSVVIGSDVGTVAGDDQPIASSQNRIEQHLTPPETRVALADTRVSSQNIVAVEGARA